MTVPEGSKEALAAARRLLREALGREAELAATAPGRVNLIGEHTDYNEGLVLPCAIDRTTAAVAARRQDGRVRVVSREAESTAGFEAAAPARTGAWVDYVQGVYHAFGREGLPTPGLDIALASTVPAGAGLSSSAALELAVATLLDAAGGLGLDGATRARLAHRAEAGFVGVPCGRMDQLASALGRRDHALRIDCRDFSVAPVAIPAARMALLVAHSGVARALADGAYASRRSECAEALRLAREAGVLPPGARAWRDLPPDRLGALAAVLPPTLLRRARHVVTEIARVEAACQALRAGDVARLGALLREGMASLRDDFEVSCPELDALCAIADGAKGCFGSRLTGAGFGGCTIHVVAPALADAVREDIQDGFRARFGRTPPVWRVQAADGARPVPLPAS